MGTGWMLQTLSVSVSVSVVRIDEGNEGNEGSHLTNPMLGPACKLDTRCRGKRGSGQIGTNSYVVIDEYGRAISLFFLDQSVSLDSLVRHGARGGCWRPFQFQFSSVQFSC